MRNSGAAILAVLFGVAALWWYYSRGSGGAQLTLQGPILGTIIDPFASLPSFQPVPGGDVFVRPTVALETSPLPSQIPLLDERPTASLP